MAGIKGLQGVVRKTVNDELQAIIWEPQHMDKLIPSMLFNMQDSDDLDRYHTLTPKVHSGTTPIAVSSVSRSFFPLC